MEATFNTARTMEKAKELCEHMGIRFEPGDGLKVIIIGAIVVPHTYFLANQQGLGEAFQPLLRIKKSAYDSEMNVDTTCFIYSFAVKGFVPILEAEKHNPDRAAPFYEPTFLGERSSVKDLTLRGLQQDPLSVTATFLARRFDATEDVTLHFGPCYALSALEQHGMSGHGSAAGLLRRCLVAKFLQQSSHAGRPESGKRLPAPELNRRNKDLVLGPGCVAPGARPRGARVVDTIGNRAGAGAGAGRAEEAPAEWVSFTPTVVSGTGPADLLRFVACLVFSTCRRSASDGTPSRRFREEGASDWWHGFTHTDLSCLLSMLWADCFTRYIVCQYAKLCQKPSLRRKTATQGNPPALERKPANGFATSWVIEMPMGQP